MRSVPVTLNALNVHLPQDIRLSGRAANDDTGDIHSIFTTFVHVLPEMVERKAANWLVPSFSVAATALALILFATGYQPNWIFVDWNGTKALPFNVTKKMEIASLWYPLKRSSMSLTCSSDGLRLMTKARLLAPAGARAQMKARQRPFAYPLRAQVTFDWVRFKDGVKIHSFKTKASIVDFGEADTIVTAPLSRRNIEILVGWFERGHRKMSPSGLVIPE